MGGLRAAGRPLLVAALLLWPAGAPQAAPDPASPGSTEGQEASGASRRVAPGQLAAALEAARPGDRLELLPGVHRGSFRIDKPLHLSGREGAVIEGPGRGTVLTLAADGINLENVAVRGSGADLSSDDAVILLLEARRITVRDCDIAAAGFGIYLREGGEHRILDNRIVGDTALPVNRRGNGVHLYYSTGNVVAGNETADVRDGIYLSFAHDNDIRDNHGSGLRYGIHYMYSERNRLEGNRFRDGVGGIALMYSMDNELARNALRNNRDFGILCLQLERSRLDGNTLSGNGRGLVLQNSARNRLRGNDVAGNGVGVYLTSGSEANLLAGNAFRRNLVQAYQEHAGDNDWSESGRGNYWGDYAGLDWNRDGVGDTPYRLQTAASALLARWPAARWFRTSPALALLDWWQTRLGPAASTGLDRFPLMRPPAAEAATAGGR